MHVPARAAGLRLEAQLVVVVAAAAAVLVVVGRASPLAALTSLALLLRLVAYAVVRLVLTCGRDERSV